MEEQLSPAPRWPGVGRRLLWPGLTHGRPGLVHAGGMPSTRNPDTSPTRAQTGAAQTSSVPADSDSDNNSASELIEAPQQPNRDKLDPHDFASGGGGGGGEAFSRKKVK